MKIFIIACGRLKGGSERDIYENYVKRLPWKVELIEVEEKKKLPDDKLKEAEGKLLLDKIPANCLKICLDEKGREFNSVDFASLIAEAGNHGDDKICFVIGGANGLSNEVRKKCDIVFSLGKLTWPHMLVRAMLAEQLYRAHTIITSHPYHKT